MFPGQQMIRDQIPEEPGLFNFYTKLKKHVTVKNILVNKVNDLLSVLHTRYPLFFYLKIRSGQIRSAWE